MAYIQLVTHSNPITFPEVLFSASCISLLIILPVEALRAEYRQVKANILLSNRQT